MRDVDPMMRIGAAVIAVLLCMWPFESYAQLAGSNSGFSSMSFIGGNEAARSVWSFGRCYARSHPDRAAALLATIPNSEAEAATFRDITKSGFVSCLNFVMRMRAPMPALRGAIAEGLYRLNRPVPTSLLLPPLSPQAPITSVQDIARCYAPAHPSEVRALVADSEPGSKEEREAARQVSKTLASCLPQGVQISLGNTQLRYLLAEAALRTSAAAQSYAGKN